MADFTEAERRALLAGLVGGKERDLVWSKFPEAIECLGAAGLVRIGHELLANGTSSSFPLCLSPIGVEEAKALQEIERLTASHWQ